MSELFIPVLPEMPALCEVCLHDLLEAVARAQFEGKRIDFHWCEHHRVLALIGWQNGRVANWSLHSHMSQADVARLFHSANAAVQHVPVTQRLCPGDTLN